MTSTLTLTPTLGLATHNAGKLSELKTLLQPLGLTLVSAAQKNVSEPEETGLTFTDNAILKAKHMADATSLTSLADDSGLTVEGLDGAPGVYSARWGGPNKDFNSAMARIHDKLQSKGIPPNGAAAAFVCVIALCDAHGHTRTFEGRIDGTLTYPMRGTKGFGYDPIFTPANHTRTFGEMSAEEKHGTRGGSGGLSHRAKAIDMLMKWLPEHMQSVNAHAQ